MKIRNDVMETVEAMIDSLGMDRDVRDIASKIQCALKFKRNLDFVGYNVVIESLRDDFQHDDGGPGTPSEAGDK